MFQLIYVRGMFQPGHILVLKRQVSIHICAGNVLCDACIRHFSSYGLFQLIYVRGMFRPQAMPRLPLELFQFIYVRGMFLLLDWRYLSLVSTHICAGNVSQAMLTLFHDMLEFQLVYAWGMFLYRGLQVRGTSARVSTHICAGNVSRQYVPERVVDVVSTHICAGNVSAKPGEIVTNRFEFQLIYARGMFSSLNSEVVRVTRCFNSYMRGECFGGSRR